MPQLQQLWNELRGKGLHIFHAECQGASQEELEEWLAKRNVTFPNTLGRGAFAAYEGESGLPYAFVVGVDGKVIWEGRRGYKKVIHEEIKKVRYLGLGKAKVAKGLEKSAALFAAGSYQKAAEAAEKAVSKAEGKGDVATDGKYIIDRVAATKKKLEGRVERYKKEREYSKALEALTKISKGFKGTPAGDAAKASIKELKKDKSVKNELKADAVYANLQKKFETMSDVDKKKSMLQGFAKQYAGTKAAARAKKQIGWL